MERSAPEQQPRDRRGTERDGRRGRAVTAMVAEAVVRDVAGALGAAGIALMPIKGVLLQRWVYDDPSERAITDVDLLVAPGRLPEARLLLEGRGYEAIEEGWQLAAVLRTPFGIGLDLHQRLFDQARYRLDEHEVFRRGSRNNSLFGVDVVLQDPLDVYAHLLGKLASDHFAAAPDRAVRDLVRVGEHAALGPEAVAERLERSGLARAARWVLPEVARRTGDPRARAVLSALRADPVGDWLARSATALTRRGRAQGALGAVAAHLVNDRVPRGLRSGVRALARRRSKRLVRTPGAAPPRLRRGR
ncbi:MAG: nucleotidyltransferase family protein [Myxococcales bacterium]|nr:nucleotidyltransferase family protein [Myxococcales bacterium]